MYRPRRALLDAASARVPRTTLAQVNRIDAQMNRGKHGREMYKRRNKVERLPRPLKGYCRIFSRLQKLWNDVPRFINFALMPTDFACVERT